MPYTYTPIGPHNIKQYYRQQEGQELYTPPIIQEQIFEILTRRLETRRLRLYWASEEDRLPIPEAMVLDSKPFPKQNITILHLGDQGRRAFVVRQKNEPDDFYCRESDAPYWRNHKQLHLIPMEDLLTCQ
jgi:hypothetical protein